jgi:hypothetical protein
VPSLTLIHYSQILGLGLGLSATVVGTHTDLFQNDLFRKKKDLNHPNCRSFGSEAYGAADWSADTHPASNCAVIWKILSSPKTVESLESNCSSR